MPADKLFAATVTGLTVFGEPAACGTVFPAADYPAALAAVREAHRSGRLEPLTPGLCPEMSVVVTVYEVPLAPPVLAAVTPAVLAAVEARHPAVLAAAVAHHRGRAGR